MTTAAQGAQYSLEAEQGVLGAMFKNPDVIPEIVGALSSEDFYEPRHRTLFDTMLRLSDEGKPTTIASVAHDLRHHGEFDRVGGAQYLTHLRNEADATAALYYAVLVHEQAIVRNLAAFHLRGLQRAQNGSGIGVEELLADAQTGLDAVNDERASSDVVKVESVFMETLDHIEALGQQDGDGTTGIPTGFADLDAKTSGLHPGQMIVVAARPAVGKSTLAMDFCRSAAIKHKQPTLFFSLEMSTQEITMRLISAECRIPLQNLKTGKLSEAEWAKIGKFIPKIDEAPFFVDDTANITMQEIKTKARRIKQRYGLKLVVIDYLQLMESAGKVESRQQEVSQISRQIKLLAKELGVTVIAVSQLNRGSENRTDKRPQVSDLRESGAIEQDADAIFLLYRDELADPDSTRIGECDIIIGKQRSGPTGTVTVASQLHLSRFFDMQQEF